VSNVVGKRTIIIALGAILALATAMSMVLSLSFSRAASASDDCILSVGSETANPAEPVSFFEIDFVNDLGNANLKVDGGATCIDWLNAGTNTFRTSVEAQNDSPSGGGDESFGQGTSEDSAIPTVTYGSIPPNKSDLKAFGLNQEKTTAGDEFLQLFWSRVQAPQGTTNMDFELNKRQCTKNFQTPGTPSTDPDCVNNGVASNKAPAAIAGKTQFMTPIRSAGDKLIAFDLASGGDTAIITMHTWVDNAPLATGPNFLPGPEDKWDAGVCLDAPPGTSDKDCPGGPTVESDALGSVNTSTIPANQAGGATNGLTTALGAQDPFTFGETSISFEALFGEGACGSFGSAYLKSRSSSAFTAEIKDFVPPKSVQISNCPTALTTDASNNGTASEPAQTVGGSISDQATLGSSVPNGADGEVVFRLYKFASNATITATSCTTATQVLTYATDGTSNVTVTNHNVAGAGNTSNPYTSASYTATEVGKYQWTAQFIPTPGQGLADSAEFGCGQAVEQSVVEALPTTTTTAQSFIPNDSATITQTAGTAQNLSGSVEFKLYDTNTHCTDNGATGLLFEQTVNVSGASAQTVSTNNDGVDDPATTPKDGYTVNAANLGAGTLFWRATYTPGATSPHTSSSSVCVEDSTITISNT
jgi:hypothetical protein